MAARIFRINYKSDFILTMQSDAGWATPFCIKFWTGAPSIAYFAGWDGTTYVHCALDGEDPTKLHVHFDDHHLPIGDLKFQIAYHFTVEDFPNNTEDEVINQAAVIIDQDGTQMQVMLDLNGETAPEIEFNLPAYANEAQRIANENQRIANEAQRIANEEQRIANEEQRISNEEQRIAAESIRIANEESRISEFAQLKHDAEIATADANAAATLANEKAALAAEKAALSQAAAELANAKATLAQQKADYAQAQGDYAKAQGDYAKDQGNIAEADHERAESDHTRAENDHTAVEVYVDSLGAFDISAYHATGGVLAKYVDLSAALDGGDNIPEAIRKGGMSVKFVQSSDNKYVQYRLMHPLDNASTAADDFTNTANWQGVDDEPTAGSDNLVKSGGVSEKLTELSGLFNSQYGNSVFDLALSDEDNNSIVRFKEGHIKTKKFDSSIDATTNSRGLMSATDKVKLEANNEKLETIEEGAEVNDVETATNAEYDLTFEDEEGYMLLKMQGGYIKTKNFDSEQQTIKLATIEEGAEVNDTLVDSAIAGDLNIEDEEKNIVACFCGGHIKTKNFDSKDIDTRVTTLEGRADYNTPSNYLGRDISTFAKIMCIGDSLTEGAFNYLSGSSFGNNTKASLLGRPYSYPQYLAKLTGCEVINLGKSGYTSSQWYDYYNTGGGADTDFSGYDCAIIQLGVNDNADTLDTVTKTALDNIINKVKTANAGIKIFFAGIINAKSYPAAIEGESYYTKDQWLRNYYDTYYANDNQVFFIDHVAYGHLRDLPNSQHGGSYPVDNYNEGHLSAYGYWRLAQDYVSIISHIMHSDQIGNFRKIQFIGTSYECY